MSEDLRAMAEEIQEGSTTLGHLLDSLQGRGYLAFVILLCLPFLTPIPLPISYLLGPIVAFIGLRLALGKKPWLPERILNAELPSKRLPVILLGAAKILTLVEKLSKPRLEFFTVPVPVFRFNALMIAWAGILLMLPLPPVFPFTNALPAYVVLFLAFGALERDGLCTLLGYVMQILTTAYFVLIFWGVFFGGKHLLDLIWHTLGAD
jgi:hypothetical protein